MTTQRAVRGIRRITMAWVGFGLLASSASGQSIMLKPKFEAGQKYYVERLTSVTQKVMRQSIQVHSVIGFFEEVKATGAKGTEFTLTIDRFGRRYSNEQIGSFDSDSPDQGQSEVLKTICRPMVGANLTMAVDKAGIVQSFKGLKAVVKKIDKLAAGNPLWGEYKDSLTAENFKHMLGSSRLALYPYKEVKAGDTWKKSFTEEDPRMGDLKYEYEVKLDQATGTGDTAKAVVSYTVTITKVGEPKKGKAGEAGMERETTFKSGTMTGTAEFDGKRGQFVKYEQKLELDLDMIVKAQGTSRSSNIKISGEEKINVLSAEKRTQEREKRAKASVDDGKEKKDKPAPNNK